MTAPPRHPGVICGRRAKQLMAAGPEGTPFGTWDRVCRSDRQPGYGVFSGGDATGDAFLSVTTSRDLSGSNFADALTGDANANSLYGRDWQ